MFYPERVILRIVVMSVEHVPMLERVYKIESRSVRGLTLSWH